MFLGVPYYDYCIIYPKTLFELLRPLSFQVYEDFPGGRDIVETFCGCCMAVFGRGGGVGEVRMTIGTGICNIYEFLAYKHPHEVDEEAYPFFLLEQLLFECFV